MSIRVSVHIQPKAASTEVVGRHGDALKIRIKAPPVNGRANDELVRFLAEWLKVPRSAVSILHGLTSRKKLVEIQGVTEQELSAAIDLIEAC